jgi:hypothetical protein
VSQHVVDRHELDGWKRLEKRGGLTTWKLSSGCAGSEAALGQEEVLAGQHRNRGEAGVMCPCGEAKPAQLTLSNAALLKKWHHQRRTLRPGDDWQLHGFF